MARIFDTTFVIREKETGMFWTRGDKRTKNLNKAWQFETASSANESIKAAFKLKENRNNHEVVTVKHELTLA